MGADRRRYREFYVQQRRRWSRDGGILNVHDDIGIDATGVGTSIAEADDIELHRGKQLEPGLRQDSGFQISCKRAGSSDDGSKFRRAVGLQGEPCLEGPEAPRQIRAKVARPDRVGSEPT